MAQGKKIAAVVNPRSAGGKTARRWPGIRESLKRRVGPVTERFTEASGAAIGAARELLNEGFDLIIAVGGDGTINEVANGFIRDDRPIRPEACLGLLPLGTGGDFQRTLGIGPRAEEAIEVLATGEPLRIDVGKASLQGSDHTPLSRYFVNLTSFGMGGEVALRAHSAPRYWGGTFAFLWATFRTFLGYRGRRVRMELDGGSGQLSSFVTNVAIGNGGYHGGGMHPCPTAVLNDGVLEVTLIEYLSLFELARDIRILYSENIYRHPKVHHYRARKILAEADSPTQVEVDGEPLGMLPLEIEVLPERLPVIAPRSSLPRAR